MAGTADGFDTPVGVARAERGRRPAGIAEMDSSLHALGSRGPGSIADAVCSVILTPAQEWSSLPPAGRRRAPVVPSPMTPAPVRTAAAPGVAAAWLLCLTACGRGEAARSAGEPLPDAEQSLVVGVGEDEFTAEANRQRLASCSRWPWRGCDQSAHHERDGGARERVVGEPRPARPSGAR